MNTRLLVVAFFYILFFAVSCKDIIEPNIGDKKLNILSPSDSLKSSKLALDFWWDELDGANSYRLQVVSPSFDSVSALLLDTLITTNKFKYSFSPGNYSWRVRAENGNSTTVYTYRYFKIDSLLDISDQELILKSPFNNFITNKRVLFSWYKIDIAQNYRLEILDNNGIIVDNIQNISTDTISYSFTSDGLYTWRVQARGIDGKSTAYSSRSIKYDRVPPGQPSLLFPKNDSIIQRVFTLTWNRAAQTGVVPNVIVDSLFIYNNVSLTNVIKSLQVNTTNHQDSLSNGSYYWRVKSMDDAGNIGVFSEVYKFTIQ